MNGWNMSAPVMAGGPEWLTVSFVLIGIGALLVLLMLAWGTRLARRRAEARAEVEEHEDARWEEEPAAPVRPITPPPPVTPPPPPLEPEALALVHPDPMEPPVQVEAAIDAPPEPASLADEPIAAAAPMDASPASLAADVSAEPAPAPDPAPGGSDELTRMKGVGPRLAARLNSLGVTSFAQIAALTPAEADALDAQLGDFQGRIHKDRWIEQAGFLSRGDVAGYEDVFGKL